MSENALAKLRAFGTPIAPVRKTRVYDSASEFVIRTLRSNIDVLKGVKTYERLAKCWSAPGDGKANVFILYKSKLVSLDGKMPWLPCPSDSVSDIEAGLLALIDFVESGALDEKLEAIKSNS